jgi:hypothetical protein
MIETDDTGPRGPGPSDLGDAEAASRDAARRPRLVQPHYRSPDETGRAAAATGIGVEQ